MHILSIHLKNIKSHRDTELSFSAGINVLSGANGAGKSTIFEAIGYALFGVDARDFVSNVDRFLSIGSKKGEISVVFRTDDGETWRVSRTVGAAAKWLLARENGGCFEVEEHARLEETGARIAELLGLNNGRSLAEQFKLVIGPFQNDFLGPFVIKQPIKRQEAFDEILGIDAWRKTYKGTGSLLAAVQKKIDILLTEVKGKQEQVAILPDRIRELSSIGSDLIQRQNGVKEQEAALASVDALLAQLETREKALYSVTHEVQLLENRITDGTAKIAEQQVRVEESRTALKVVEESKNGKDAFDRIEIRLALLRQQAQQRRIVEQDIAGLEKEALRLSQYLEHERSEIGKAGKQLDSEHATITEARQKLHPDAALAAVAARLPECRKEREALAGQRSLLDGRRESLLEGKDKLAEGTCPFFREPCRNIAGSAPRDVFSSRIAELDHQGAELDARLLRTNAQLQEAEAAEKELNNRAIRMQELDKQAAGLEERRGKNGMRAAGLDAITAQQAEAVTRVNARKGELNAFVALDASIAEAEAEQRRQQPARDAYTANLNVAQELDVRIQHLEKMRQLLKVLTEERAVKQALRDELNSCFQPELLRQSRQEKERVLAAVATLRQQIIDLVRTAERLEAEIAHLDRIQGEIESRRADITSYEEKEKLVKFLRNQVFKNVSAQLSERFREEISLRADRIYRTIAESDEELYWGDNYQIILKDMQGGTMRERSDDQLSGGQMMSAVVALRLALLQTIGARVAFFDEPTSNLDAARRENLAHAFRAIDVGREEVTEHWYDQLFLVSHDVAFTEITDKVIEL